MDFEEKLELSFYLALTVLVLGILGVVTHGGIFVVFGAFFILVVIAFGFISLIDYFSRKKK